MAEAMTVQVARRRVIRSTRATPDFFYAIGYSYTESMIFSAQYIRR